MATTDTACTCDQSEVLVAYYGCHYVDCPEYEPELTHAERRQLRELLRPRVAKLLALSCLSSKLGWKQRIVNQREMTVRDARPVLEANWDYLADVSIADLPAVLCGMSDAAGTALLPRR